MKIRIACLLVMLLAALSLRAQGGPVSFNLSTSKSFAPGETPNIHLYTHNVDALEFRIYRVHDPVKFMENLRELHSFGSEAGGPQERIDERTWLERFHDWKTSIWENIRSFFRNQLSRTARSSLRRKQSAITRHSRIVSEAEFAQVPILNQSQLVSRWRMQVPATFISDSNQLDVPKLSAGLYLLEATDGRFKAYTVVMVSSLALVTRTGSGGVTAFVVDRASGKPASGVKVDAGFGQKLLDSATTDDSGVAQLAVPDDKSAPDNFWVIASKDDEVAASTPGTWALTYSTGSKYAGYIFTERPVYRPTHTVHWEAILREHSGNTLTVPKPANVHVTISDESDKAVFNKDMPISPTGDVTGDFDLPRDASLGYYSIAVGSSPQDVLTAGFHVEDYRKPEYRVQVAASQKRVLEGATMPVTVDSRYFFGEPVANAKVKYRIYHDRHYWWGEDESEDNSGEGTDGGDNNDSYAGDEQAEQTGKLDANGLLTIQVPTRPDTQGVARPDYDYTVEAGVTDAANREITGRGRFLATYGTFRVNVEPISYAVHAGESARFKVTTVDYDEKPVSTRVHVQLTFRHYSDGKTVTTNGPSVDVTTDAAGTAAGAIPVGSPQGSSAELEATATAVQSGTRDPVDDSYLWIMGAGQEAWNDSSQSSQIVADKKSYAPGDTAHLSILSDKADFYALVIAQGDVIQKRMVMHSDGKTLAFDLPITADSQPNITVSAIYVRDNTVYQATKNLKVPPVQQQLQVLITPAKDVLQPQQAVTYDVLSSDHTGKPVSADLSFGVVDEAIYSLYPDSSGDMVRHLYPERSAEVQVDSSLDYYFSGEAGVKSPMLAMRNARYRPQLAQVKPGNEQKPRVRKAFPDTAFWAPRVHTDATGHAKVTFTFPDSLTTWRATVHAITADSKAGSTINRVLVRKNVLVRMGTPRFMIKGDELTLPVIVHNYLPDPQQATVSLKADGLDVVTGTQQAVTVPSRGEATVLWRLRASQVGTAKLTASAITSVESDALELSFPVQPAGVARDIAHTGVLDQGSPQASAAIDFPANTDAAAHTLHIDVSSSIAGALFPALDYLTSYPYGCTEQTMSSFLPNLVVAETLNRLHPANKVDMADLNAKLQAGLARLKDYQHDDGGWGWWKEDDSRVYMTAYVVSGIGQATAYTKLVPEQQNMLRTGAGYLEKNLQQHPRMRPDLRAAVVYALAMSHSTQLAHALDDEWSRRNDLAPEALAMTGLAMLEAHDARAAQIAALLASKAVRKGDLVSWKGEYVPMLDAEYSDDAEATAFAVRLLAKLNPNDPMMPGAAQWLMQARQGAWWDSTEQTAMVLFGLVDYLAASHELDADFTVEVTVNGHGAGQKHFTAADAQSGASLSLDIPASQLTPHDELKVTRRDGSGRIYWTARGRYYSTAKGDYQAGALSLNLVRDYYKLEPVQKDGKIVYAMRGFSGTAQVGDVLAVHEAISGSPESYLLVEDPIPAGAEFITSDDSYPIEDRPSAWYGWFTRREFHDDHAAFFANQFSGHQEIFYLIRIVNPGTFQVSPARVTPMYQPGIQATSDSLRMQVPSPAPAGGAQ